jgi:hypothetical protein
MRSRLIAVGWFALIPSAVFAQASITGVVRDTSGAVLPGVTVEVSSPALIERTRRALTDGTGQYRLVELPRGMYLVTFTLPGFSVVRREGVELTGSFTATVNAQLSVGGVTETITVTGESPIVDVTSTSVESVLSAETLAAIPTARSYNALAILVPGVVGLQQDVATGPCNSCVFMAHGGRRTEGMVQVDGMNMNVPQAGSSMALVDVGNSEEVTLAVSGGLGEAMTGGPVFNAIPRSGGNQFQGTIFGTFTTEGMVGDNFTDDLRAAGLTAPNPVLKSWEINPGFGGPIRRDRLWFYASFRHQGFDKGVTNLFENANAYDPLAWTYRPDTSRQAVRDRRWASGNVRLTTQVTQRNKLQIYYQEQAFCPGCNNGFTESPFSSVEANVTGELRPHRQWLATWSSPWTNRLLLEAGWGGTYENWSSRRRDPRDADLIRVTEQCAACAGNPVPTAPFTYRAQNTASNWNLNVNWRASASYVTGTHAVKSGFQGAHLGVETENFINSWMTYTFFGGVPNSFTMDGGPARTKNRTRWIGLYIQDQWTRGRLTLQGAARYDRAWSYSPEQVRGGTTFLPNEVVFPYTKGIDAWNDITPRMGAAYDLFGTGRTALKVNVSKYVEMPVVGGIYDDNNPAANVVTSGTRSWTDGNRNYIPDCNLLNPAAQDNRATGGDFCGATPGNFGRTVVTTRVQPELLSGWGIRPSDWNLLLSVQQQVGPRVSVEVGYNRRWFSGFFVTDNLNLGPSDFTQFALPAPTDPRLPNGGGYSVGPLYNVNPDKFSVAPDNWVSSTDQYGNARLYWHGFDVNVNARGRNFTVQGGTSTGRTMSDTCEIRAVVPESTLLDPNCRPDLPFLTYVKGIATYTVPRLDVQVSATFQNNPGVQQGGLGDSATGVGGSIFGYAGTGGWLGANYVYQNADVRPYLGRDLSGNVQTITVDVMPAGQLFGDRVTQLDLRLAKIMRLGRTRTMIGVDIYNLLNADTILNYSSSFTPNGPWLTPTSVMTARFFRISGQFDF